jgi:probable DNA metabolism protein
VRLDSEDDAAGFRAAARRLLASGIEPARVRWQVATAVGGELFGDGEGDDTADGSLIGPATAAGPSPLSLPAALLALIERAALHANRDRHALLYRLLWRLAHEPGLRHDPLDPDRLRAEHLARAVRRDMHKMTAFVRFRPITVTTAVSAAADAQLGQIRHVAWFEPEHHIVEATAPFFARRFAQMDWAILTPDRCVRWDGHALQFGPGARRDQAPGADAAERLWLTYYESIFNPARLKLAMMRKEMPRRYWKNLPEAVLIQPLAARAAERSDTMIEQGASEAKRPRRGALPPVRQLASDESVRPPTLEDIGQAADCCRRCPIGAQATQAVPGTGPRDARLMIVGEQPGDQEDLQGRPFVGPAGRLLDRAFARLGWARDTLYLTNAVKHFKFELRGKRRLHKTPAQREAAACLHWLEAEIALVKPQALVALGATAARSLLGRAVAVTSERGWHRRPDGLRVLVTWHPAALLRMDPVEANAAFETWVTDLAQASARAC